MLFLCEGKYLSNDTVFFLIGDEVFGVLSVVEGCSNRLGINELSLISLTGVLMNKIRDIVLAFALSVAAFSAYAKASTTDEHSPPPSHHGMKWCRIYPAGEVWLPPPFGQLCWHD